MRKFHAIVLSIVSVFVLATPKPAEAANGDYRVRARVGANDAAQAKATYRERLVGNVLIQRFNVQVEDFVPGVAVQVRINGNLFGNIVPNALGIAELEFATFVLDNTPGDDHPPLPTDFPRINVGDTITFGTLTATFILR